MPGPPPEPDADPDLIRRWRRGDRAAFEELVRAWGPRVGRFLARLTGCAETARDLSQDVFLRVYLAAGTYRDDGRFGPWLFQVTANAARDAARRKALRTHAPLPAVDPPVTGAGGDAAEAAERAAAVAAALADLPGPLREVVVLRYYEDLSFEAMARVLGTPATTLKSRFAVAVRQLQERLSRFREE